MACFVILSDHTRAHEDATLLSGVARAGCLIFQDPRTLLEELGALEGRILLFVDLQPKTYELLECFRLLGQARFTGTLILTGASDARTAYSASVLARHFGLDVMRCLTAIPTEQDILSILIEWEVRPQVIHRAIRKTYTPQEIREAIEKKQLVNYYQPKISLADHRFRGVIRMAQGMGIRTAPEGVDTADEFDFLRKTGCDYAQGYLMARPMSADDILSFSKNA